VDYTGAITVGRAAIGTMERVEDKLHVLVCVLLLISGEVLQEVSMAQIVMIDSVVPLHSSSSVLASEPHRNPLSSRSSKTP